MEQQGFEELRKSVLDRMIQYNTCESSQNEVMQSNNDGILFSLLHKYWLEILKQYRKPFIKWLDSYYATNKEALNRIGVWFNESTDKGKAIVTQGTIVFYGDAKVWAYNLSHIVLHDNAHCTAKDSSHIECLDNSSAMLLDESTCHAYVRSKVNAGGESVVDAYDACTITAGERSTVIAHSWNQITAVGEAEVFAPSKYKIKILGQAKLTLKKPEEL